MTSPTVLLLMTFLSGVAEAEKSAMPVCDTPRVMIDLPLGAAEGIPEVCVNPDFPTTFVFDPPLPPGAVLELEPANRFAQSQGSQLITLLPQRDYLPGERARLSVRFSDGAVPANVVFSLVGHPAKAVTQVQVFRHGRPVDSCQQEAREIRVEAGRCREEIARLLAEPGRPDGLRGLFDAGLIGPPGVVALPLNREVAFSKETTLKVSKVTSYRTTGSEENGRGRVAVEVKLSNSSTTPWTVVGAALTGAKGEELTPLPVWHTGTISPGAESGRVVVEVDATSEQARGHYTLKLWDAVGRVVIVGRVRFP